MSKVLVADDDHDIVSTLKAVLEADGFEVLVAKDGRATLDAVETNCPDLLILDWNFPDLSGLRVCSELRRGAYDLPILFLTGRDAEFDKVAAFDAGVDDYVTKPFSLLEILGRCKALLRRKRGGTSVFVVGDLIVDQMARQVTCNGELVNLTPKEFSLLVFLASHAGQPVSREILLQKVWGYEFYGNTRTVDVHVSRLRNKLQDDNNSPKRILTVKSIGYKLVPLGEIGYMNKWPEDSEPVRGDLLKTRTG